jgi:hypothetical protein
MVTRWFGVEEITMLLFNHLIGPVLTIYLLLLSVHIFLVTKKKICKPENARRYQHLQHIADQIPHYDDKSNSLLLLGLLYSQASRNFYTVKSVGTISPYLWDYSDFVFGLDSYPIDCDNNTDVNGLYLTPPTPTFSTHVQPATIV